LIPLIEHSETTADSIGFLPPNLRTEQETAPLARGPWYLTIAPAYLGIFVWAPFFDALWVGDLARLPLVWLIASAVFASLVCFGLLYYVPASWGFQTGRPLGVLAASTFGTVGSEWITAIAVGVACIFWYAVAIDYAVDSTLLGLKACGLIAAENLPTGTIGPIVVKSPVYLCTALFWIYITGTSGLWKLPGVVVALMRVYAPVALLLLTAVALWQLPDIGAFRSDTASGITAHFGFADRWRGHHSVVQLMISFFAMAGLMSVEWGARVERRRDVVMGGLTGIVLAASWTAIMSLVVVAAAVGQVTEGGKYFDTIVHFTDVPSPSSGATLRGIDLYLASIKDPSRFSFRWAVYYGIGGVPAGVILILFGLAALAPACYAASVFGQKLSTHWPRLGQFTWTWIGGAIAFALGAASYADELELIFVVMGAVFAPAVGAMAADWLRQRGAWAGLRPGVNRTGIIAWVAGMMIAFALEFGPVAGLGQGWRTSHEVPWWQSTAICGFVAAFAYYLLLAGLGRERPAVVISRREIGR
jgi:cytosine permease